VLGWQDNLKPTTMPKNARIPTFVATNLQGAALASNLGTGGFC